MQRKLTGRGILLLIFLSQAWMYETNAQASSSERYSIIFRNVSLEEALERLVSTTLINLLYDPELVADATVSCRAKDYTAEDILRCLTLSAQLDFYQLSSGTYVLTERAEEPPQLGNLAGIVVDKITGEPLPFANVLLSDALTGTATNSAGLFTFASLITGPHEIVTTYVGYRPSYDSVWVTPDGQIRQRIELEPETIVSDPIVINGMQQRLPSAELGLNSVIPDGQNRAAGGLPTDDPIYSVSSISNIGIRAPFVDLHIQGGEAGEHQILLDGVPVFEPVTLGRLMGAFSPLAISRITVHKAGFAAPQGSYLSGVLQAEQHLKSKDFEYASFRVDPLSINGRINFDIELPGSASSRFMVATRSSYWDVYRYASLNNLLQDWNVVDPLLSNTAINVLPSDQALFTPHRHGSDVSFSDIHAASTIQLNPFNKLFVSFYQGSNKISSELLSSEDANVTDDTFILLTRDRYRWTNTTGQIRYHWLMGSRLLGMLKARNSLHTLRHDYQFSDNQTLRIPSNTGVPFIEHILLQSLDNELPADNRNRIEETALEASLDFSLSKDQHVQIGAEFAHLDNRFQLDSLFFEPLSIDYSGTRTSGFVHSSTAIGLRTTLEVGSRFTYVRERQTLYVEPRLSVRHDMPATPAGDFSFHGAAGIYRQFINQFDLSNAGPSAAVPSLRFWMPIDESVSPPTAYHLAGNLLWKPDESVQVRFESFYKHQPHILEVDYDAFLLGVDNPNRNNVTERDILEPTNGHSFGGSLFLSWRFTKGLSSVQYSYSKVKRRYPDRFNGHSDQTTPWNEPHRFTLSQDVFLISRLSARLRANAIWGRSWGFRKAYYDYLAAHNGPANYPPFVLDNPSADKLPPIYQIDLGASYEYSFTDIEVVLRADFLNVLDRDNVVDWGLTAASDPDSFEKVNRVMPGISTALSLEIRF